MSVYGRLNYNFDSAKFNGADQLTTGVLNLLGNTSINLSDWQVDDLSNNQVNGYYTNPHNDTLGVLSVCLTGYIVYANTQYVDYSNSSPEIANTLYSTSSSAQTSLTNFTNHTNNLSGVTKSNDISLYPDLNSALAIGRQMLNITNKTDNVQNNTPILGNFTSLYIGPDILNYANTIVSNFITFSNAISESSGNLSSNISNSVMNSAISDIQNLQTLLDTTKNGDITFYQNSYEIMNEYQTVLQFSNLGATQNNLITLIGTNKLKNDLGTPL